MVSLAELGNSTLKHQHILILANAANDDVTIMLIQEDEYKHFIDNVCESSGVGPNKVVGLMMTVIEKWHMQKNVVKLS